MFTHRDVGYAFDFIEELSNVKVPLRMSSFHTTFSVSDKYETFSILCCKTSKKHILSPEYCTLINYM